LATVNVVLRFPEINLLTATGIERGSDQCLGKAGPQYIGRISSGVEPKLPPGTALAGKAGWWGSAGQPCTQGFLLPMPGNGEGCLTNPIAINLSSLQASLYPSPRNTRLPPKPKIHKAKASRTKLYPLSRALAPIIPRLEPNRSVPARRPDECTTKLEPPGQTVVKHKASSRIYTCSQAPPSAQRKKISKSGHRVSSFPASPRRDARLPSTPAFWQGETVLSESAALDRGRGGTALPASAQAEPQGASDEDLHSPLMAELGSDHIDDILDLVWGDRPTPVAHTLPPGDTSARQLVESTSRGVGGWERGAQVGEVSISTVRVAQRGLGVWGSNPSSSVSVMGALLPPYKGVVSPVRGCSPPPTLFSPATSSSVATMLHLPLEHSQLSFVQGELASHHILILPKLLLAQQFDTAVPSCDFQTTLTAPTFPWLIWPGESCGHEYALQ
jgi:hypothetical protein